MDLKVRGWASPIPYGTSEETSIVLDKASHDDFAAWDFAACAPIEDWPKDARMSCVDLEGNRSPDDVVPNHLGLIVVSQKCRDTMEEVPGIGNCVQFLPVQLDYRGEDFGVYYVVNVIASVAAFDNERSRYDVYTSLDVGGQPIGSVKSIRRLVLLPGALKADVPVFRLREKLTWVLFSPLLRSVIDLAGVTGFDWWEVALSSDAPSGN